MVALNKTDLVDQWVLGPRDVEVLSGHAWHPVRTSAKTGEGVESAFAWLARATLSPERPS